MSETVAYELQQSQNSRNTAKFKRISTFFQEIPHHSTPEFFDIAISSWKRKQVPSCIAWSDYQVLGVNLPGSSVSFGTKISQNQFQLETFFGSIWTTSIWNWPISISTCWLDTQFSRRVRRLCVSINVLCFTLLMAAISKSYLVDDLLNPQGNDTSAISFCRNVLDTLCPTRATQENNIGTRFCAKIRIFWNLISTRHLTTP